MIGFASALISDDLIWILDWLWRCIFLFEDHGYFGLWELMMCTLSSLIVKWLWLILMLEDSFIMMSWIHWLHFQWELPTMMMWWCRIGS